MILSEQQNDALRELINIAFGRTAAALSELTGNRVLLDLIRVTVCPVGELADALRDFLPEHVATVHQVFNGPVAGDALLLLDPEAARGLVDLLTDEKALFPHLDASAREVLTEVGNILLNACLGMFGDLLQVHLSFSVPRMYLEDLDDLLSSIIIGKDEVRYALLIYTAFRIQGSAVGGFLVIALGVNSLDRLMAGMEAWEAAYVEE